MKDDEVYYEEESAFSFKDMFKFLKHAFPMVIICLVLVVMLGVSVCGILYAADRNAGEVTQAVIELTYKGADKGLAPDGSSLDIQGMKSIDKISKILKSQNMTYSPTAVRNAITITGFYSSSIQKLLDSVGGDEKKLLEVIGENNIYPTQYVLILKHKSIEGMSREDSKVIVDGLLRESEANIFTRVSNYDFLPSVDYTKENFSDYDYLEKMSVFSMEIAKLQRHIDAMKILTRENGVSSFDSFLLNFNSINAMINKAEVFILNNGIAKDVASTITVLADQIESLTRELDSVVAEGVKLKKAIDDYKLTTGIITNDQGVIINGGAYVIEAYKNMYTKYMSLLENESSLSMQISTLTTKKDKYTQSVGGTATEEQINSANLQVEKIISSMADTTRRIEVETDNYYRENRQTGMVIKLAGSVAYNNTFSPNWILCIVISAILGIFLGLGVYALVLNNKKKKALRGKTKVLAVATASTSVEAASVAPVEVETSTIEKVEDKPKQDKDNK